jgi:hypothetical protein
VEFLQFCTPYDVSMGKIVLDAVNEERLIETFNNPSIQAQ